MPQLGHRPGQASLTLFLKKKKLNIKQNYIHTSAPYIIYLFEYIERGKIKYNNGLSLEAIILDFLQSNDKL